MHSQAEDLFRLGATIVLLDGRTYSKRYQVEDLEAFAGRINADLFFIECTADAEMVRSRLENDARKDAHPAKNRSPALYLALRDAAEPITREKLVVDTGMGTHEQQLARCLGWLQGKSA
jgi:adenylylsulfate kinase